MEKRNIISRYYEVTGIMLCLVDESGKLLESAPSADCDYLNKFVDGKFIHQLLKQFKNDNRNMDNPMLCIFQEGFMVGMAQVEEDRYLFFGPASSVSKTEREIVHFSDSLVAPVKEKECSQLLQKTPILSYRKYVSIMSVGIYLLSDRNISIDHIIQCNQMLIQKELELDATHQRVEQHMDMAIHTSRNFEIGILNAIESGNIETLHRRLMEPMSGEIGKMSQNTLQQERYIFVSFVALVVRSAIAGGIDEETSFSMGDIYCQQMDLLNSQKDIVALCYKMAMDFCDLVKKTKQNCTQFSPAVERCQRFISSHLYEQIRMDDLAEYCGLCSKTIARKFKEETGWTIIDYIQKKKMYEAGYLLKYSEYSILEISNLLQYATQSYFTKTFKDIYGMTPKQYRDHKKDSSFCQKIPDYYKKGSARLI